MGDINVLVPLEVGSPNFFLVVVPLAIKYSDSKHTWWSGYLPKSYIERIIKNKFAGLNKPVTKAPT